MEWLFDESPLEERSKDEMNTAFFGLTVRNH